MIARNAEETIGACLDSIVPFVEQVVVCVDRDTTDKTARVALDHGAKVVLDHVVSEWHECPEHGKVMAQHFGRARDESFKHLRQDVDWFAWIDSDDVLLGGEHLARELAELPPEVDGVWLAYQYSSTPNGRPSTLFDRERILRRTVGWHWDHRVHEVAVPNGKSSEQAVWAKFQSVRVLHQEKGHSNEKSAKRNILLLEIELEEKSSDESWCLQYMGNQYFALGEWEQALGYFNQSLRTPNIYQKWLTHIYRSTAYEKLSDLERSKDAAFAALALKPHHPEPYLRLACLCMLRGEVQDCETWTRIADGMVPPPSVVFSNPMDTAYNRHVTLGQAYYNAGMPSKARSAWEQAYSVVPMDSIKEGIGNCEKLERNANTANAYVEVLRGRSDQEVRDFFANGFRPAEDILAYGRLRDRVVPALLKTRPNTQPRIVFWCGRSAEAWYPGSLNTTGIGGSETAVVKIAERFNRAGWRVDVFNEPERYEGEHDGVGYWSLNRLGSAEKADVLVGWRNPEVCTLPIERHVSLLWMHDLNAGPGRDSALAQWGKVLGVSAWHGEFLASLYRLTNTDFVPNGIELDRFAKPVAKVPFRCVYASSPDRGLVTLLKLWPELVETEPSAELHIAYGWNTIDKYIQMGHLHLAGLKAEVNTLLERTPNVKWRGRLPQDQLAQLYQESYCWLYPTTFLEVSCISAMESMAGGCVPITSAAGALKETIGDAGIVVTGNAYTTAWREFWLSCARATLGVRDMRLPLVEKGRVRAQEFSWDKSFEKWESILLPLMMNDGQLLPNVQKELDDLEKEKEEALV